MKGNFLSSLIGHVREQKINKTSCGFVLSAHCQKIQTKYGWMDACMCMCDDFPKTTTTYCEYVNNYEREISA